MPMNEKQKINKIGFYLLDCVVGVASGIGFIVFLNKMIKNDFSVSLFWVVYFIVLMGLFFVWIKLKKKYRGKKDADE